MSAVIPSAPSKNPFDDDVIAADCDTDQLRTCSSPARSPVGTPALRGAAAGGPSGGRSGRLRSSNGCSGGSPGGERGSSTGGGGCCDRPCCRRCSERCFTCTARCTRILLVGPNLLFLLFGATLVGLGVWMRADRESSFYLEILRSIPASPILAVDQVPVAIIAVGSCVVILSFLGCCGACFESVCFLCLYALFLTLMVAAEIIVGIILAVMHEQLLMKLSDSMKHQIRYDYNNTDLKDKFDNASYQFHLATAWNNMQTEFSCCGADGPEDFNQSAWYNWTRPYHGSGSRLLVVPPSCCLAPPLQPGFGQGTAAAQRTDCQDMAMLLIRGTRNQKVLESIQKSALKTQGCRASLLNQLKRNLSILIGVGSAVVLLQIVDFGFACVLMSWFRKKQSEYPWYEDDDFD